VPDSSINQLLNWEVRFLCEKKTFKKDRKDKKNELIVSLEKPVYALLGLREYQL
jgi:hypothetical protein